MDELSRTGNDLSEKKVEKVIIVGAGLAGLTAADLLSSAGIMVEVYEEQPFLGGLASTYYQDDLFADAGPHRFHTSDESVMSYIKSVLGEDYYTIRRFSGVRAFNSYHNWPLTINSLFRLPLGIMLKSGIDLFFRPKIKDQSFRSYVINKYGKTLYKYFFKGYTEKFIKLDPKYVHADWAKGGIDRAIIDKRIKMNNLFDIARRMLFPSLAKTEFIYPKGGGIDMFSRRLGERVAQQLAAAAEPVGLGHGQRADGVVVEPGAALLVRADASVLALEVLQCLDRSQHDLLVVAALVRVPCSQEREQRQPRDAGVVVLEAPCAAAGLLGAVAVELRARPAAVLVLVRGEPGEPGFHPFLRLRGRPVRLVPGRRFLRRRRAGEEEESRCDGARRRFHVAPPRLVDVPTAHSIAAGKRCQAADRMAPGGASPSAGSGQAVPASPAKACQPRLRLTPTLQQLLKCGRWTGRHPRCALSVPPSPLPPFPLTFPCPSSSFV